MRDAMQGVWSGTYVSKCTYMCPFLGFFPKRRAPGMSSKLMVLPFDSHFFFFRAECVE